MEKQKHEKYYEVMFFETPHELIGEGSMEYFVHIGSKTTKDKITALDWYCGIANPASQFIEADSIKELADKRREMVNNMSNPVYCREKVFPCL